MLKLDDHHGVAKLCPRCFKVVRTKAMAQHYLNQVASTWDRLDPCIPEPKMSKHSELRSFQNFGASFLGTACIIESLKERWKSSLLVFGPFRVSFGLEKLFVGVCCVFLIVFPPLLNFCLVRGHVQMISKILLLVRNLGHCRWRHGQKCRRDHCADKHPSTSKYF